MTRRSLLLCLLLVAGCRSQLWDATAPDSEVPYRARVIRACTLAASCGGAAFGSFAPPLSISRCIDGFADRIGSPEGLNFGVHPVVVEQILSCSAAATCAAFTDCYGGDSIELSACREGAVCKGTVMQSLNAAGGAATYDCDALGYVCTELSTGAIRSCCTPKICSEQFATTCDTTTRATVCLAGATLPVDCGATGLVCNPGSGSYTCLGTGPSCVEETTVNCSGSVATYCVGERLGTFDCAKGTFRSRCNAGGLEPCTDQGTQCTSFGPETCSAGSIQICVDGAFETLDCKTLGFAGCDLLDGRAICR